MLSYILNTIQDVNIVLTCEQVNVGLTVQYLQNDRKLVQNLYV